MNGTGVYRRMLRMKRQGVLRPMGSVIAFRRLIQRGLRALVALEELLHARIGGLGTLAHMAKLDEQEQFLVTECGGINHGNPPYCGFAARF